MIAGSLAKRYAKALADVAAASGELEPVARELAECADLLRAQRELRQFFANPSILKRNKLAAFGEIAGRMGLRTLTATFLRVVLEAGRLGALDGILRAYEGLVDERLNRVRAQVTAAVALDPATEQQLRQRLRERLGREVVLEVREDPALLGGIVTRVGSVVYDGSLRAQLARLRQELVQG